MNDKEIFVLWLNDGTYVVLGDVILQEDWTLTFDYLRPDSSAVPEPSVLVLLGLGGLAVWGLMTRKRYKNISKGETLMKHLIILLGAGLIMLLYAETTSAANLKVIRVGNGSGKVIGDEIECSPFCEATYPPETILHLEAISNEGSTFEGWMVNGKPSQGTIVIQQEDILVAAKFSKESDLDDTIIMWYSGDRKMYATIALDELIVFPGFPMDVEELLEIDYEVFLEELVSHFHPDATIADGYLVWLKSPEPLSFLQLTERIKTLHNMRYVRQVSPVLYLTEGLNPMSVLTGDITVKFPSHYTDALIQSIEQEYGLTRFEYDEPDPLSLYHYQVSGDALQAVEISKRLYESGLVEHASPDRLIEATLNQADPPPTEEQDVPEPWHLQEIGNMAAAAPEDDYYGQPLLFGPETVTVDHCQDGPVFLTVDVDEPGRYLLEVRAAEGSSLDVGATLVVNDRAVLKHLPLRDRPKLSPVQEDDNQSFFGITLQEQNMLEVMVVGESGQSITVTLKKWEEDNDEDEDEEFLVVGLIPTANSSTSHKPCTLLSESVGKLKRRIFG